MSERKVLNKWYPPDFDPAKVPRMKRAKNQQYVVRLMAPFSMRCNSCLEYVYKGKKFNARKETVEGEDYLGIKIYRFYIRCPVCAAEITFKTDPKNADYVCELGASRNFEKWRSDEQAQEDAKKEKADQEENNPIRALENRTAESKREINIEEGLEKIRAFNARHNRIDIDQVIENVQRENEMSQLADSDEDEKLVQQIFGKRIKLLHHEVIENGLPVDQIANSNIDCETVKQEDDYVCDDSSVVKIASSDASFGTSSRIEPRPFHLLPSTLVNGTKQMANAHSLSHVSIKKDKLSVVGLGAFIKKKPAAS